MSITAGRLIDRALKRILVGAADASPEPDEYADALDDLNNLMASLEADGVRLGYTPVDNVSDVVTVPPGAVLPIIANLAVSVAPDYSAPVPPALAAQAIGGMQTLLKLGRAKLRMSYPSTLPMGAGNTGYYGNDVRYFGESVYGLLTLAGNTLLTTFEAPDYAVRVVGDWHRVDAEGMRTDIAGRMSSLYDRPVTVKVSLTLSAVGTGDYLFKLVHNYVSIGTVSAALIDTDRVVTLSQSVILNPSDYLEVWVEGTGHQNPMVLVSSQFEVG